MKLYEIGDKSKWMSNSVFRTVEKAKATIKDLVRGDTEVWTDDFIIWEIDTILELRTEYETINIETLKETI
jgi:hypothetical protein